MNYCNYLMLGLDQAKCLHSPLFISLIAASSSKVPPVPTDNKITPGPVEVQALFVGEV